MRRNGAIHGLTVLDHLPDDIRQVLVQRAAPSDIERLRAATDPQDRKLQVEGLQGDRVLEGVKARLGRAKLIMRFGTVGRRGEIRAAREHQRV